MESTKGRANAWKTTARQLQRNLKKVLGPSLPADLPFTREVNELRDELVKEEAEEKIEIEKGVHEAKQAVAQVKQYLNSLNPPEGDNDVQLLQDSMNISQQHIATTKEYQRTGFHRLQKQGDLIERELEVFEEKLNSELWDGAIGQKATQPAKPAQAKGEGLLPEVLEYETFEEEHGHCGNWHAEDHAEFMKVLKENKHDYAATVSQCSESMIGFDRLDIIAHAQWHSKYVELGLRKKLAIQQWQQQRSHEALTEKALAADMIADGVQPSRGANNKRNAQQELQRQYTKAVVAQWKACKAEEQARASEAKAAAKAEKQARERATHRQRQQQLAAVLAHQRAEQAQAHCEELHADRASNLLKQPSKAGSVKGGAGRPLTAEKRQALAERNRKHVENRTAALQAVKEQQARRAAIQAKLCSKCAVKGEADPSRLYQNTAASAMRIAAEKENDHSAKDGGYIRLIPKKGGGGIHA